jgi:hypothetical protein
MLDITHLAPVHQPLPSRVEHDPLVKSSRADLFIPFLPFLL